MGIGLAIGVALPVEAHHEQVGECEVFPRRHDPPVYADINNALDDGLHGLSEIMINIRSNHLVENYRYRHPLLNARPLEDDQGTHIVDWVVS